MGIKLFKAETRIVSYFWGDDEENNEDIATEALINEINTRENLIELDSIEEVTEDVYIEDHWLDGIPYGAVDDDRTVSEIIESGDFQLADSSEDYNEEYSSYEEPIQDDEPNIDDDVWKDEL